MANRRDALTVATIAGFTVLTACAGLYLGFLAPRVAPRGKMIAKVPDQGPIIYEMRSVFSEPNRIRLEWREVPGALGYRVKIMTATDDSLFTSPDLDGTAWTIPQTLTSKLDRQTVYHWQLRVQFLGRSEISEASAFATQ